MPDDIRADPVYMQLYEKTRQVTRSNLHDLTRQTSRPAFTEADFTAVVVGMRLNAVGGLLITLETSGSEKDNGWPLSDASTSGEEIQIHATRKA